MTAKALIVRDGKLLLSFEGNGKWAASGFRGLPGDGVNYGEDFQAGLIRELREEMNLEISKEQLSQQPIKLTFGVCSDGINVELNGLFIELDKIRNITLPDE